MSNLLSHAFGPGDISCVAILPGAALVLDEVIDASYSEHADKIPIRRLGHRLPVGWAYGSATLAGTLVCAQLTKGALWRVRSYYGAVSRLGEEVFRRDSGRVLVEESRDFFASAISVTQLPPIHLMWIHMSEEGQMGIARWYNVVFSDKSGVFGANNRYVEQTLQYQCTYQEELRLHRSLTVSEMQALKNRTSGFFGTYHKPESLVESLSAVAGEIARDYVLGGDLVGYLFEETREVIDRTRAGELTSINIADQELLYFQSPSYVPGEDPRMRVAALEAPISEKLPVIGPDGTTTFETVEGTLRIQDGFASLVPRSGTPVGLGRLETNPHAFNLSGASYARWLAPEKQVRPELLPQSVQLRVTRTGDAISVVRSGTFPDPSRVSSAGAFDPTGVYNVAWSGTTFSERYTVTRDDEGYLLSGTLGPLAIRPTRGRFEQGAYVFDIVIGVGTPARRRIRITAAQGAARLVRESGEGPLLRSAGQAAGSQAGDPLRYLYLCTLPTGLSVRVTEYREDAEQARKGDVDVEVRRPGETEPTVHRVEAASRTSPLTVVVGEGRLQVGLPPSLSGQARVEYIVDDRTAHSAPVALQGEHLTADGIDLVLTGDVVTGEVYGAPVTATLGQAGPLTPGSDTLVRIDQRGGALTVALSQLERRIA